jgi:hypothetical protein
MLRFLKRVFRESLSLHLLLPLAVSILVGSAIGYLQGKIASALEFRHFLSERLPELLAIYITFVVVLVLLIWRETAIRIANVGSLDNVLMDSRSYLAFAAIPLSEWFDPSVQVYLARIVAQQQQVKDYSHQRVLLFFSHGDLEAVHASYLDEYHARCLIRIHQLHRIGLAFLPHDQLLETLTKLTVAERKMLRCYPRPIGMLPDWILNRVRVSWVRRRIAGLAFAVVSYEGGRSSVVLFSKGRKMLDIRRVDTPAGMAPYLRFVDLVQKQICRADGTLSSEYDFAGHMAI